MTPKYRWACHACDKVNAPGKTACAFCGFPAVASGADIAKARGAKNPTAEGYRALAKGSGWFAYLFAMFS